MPNSDTRYGVHNKITTIFSQPYDGSTALTTFSSVADAKNYFFTTAAQTVIDECATQLQWSVVNDARGDATSLKLTIAFGIVHNAADEQWGAAYNRRMKALQDAEKIFTYTISGTPTTVNGNDDAGQALTYTANFADVYHNGVLKTSGVTKTSGNSVVFDSALGNGDTVVVVSKHWNNNVYEDTNSTDHLF